MPQIDIRVPDLGSFKDVAVIELLVAPGDTLEVDTPIATLETDKATMDVPSSAAGTVVALHLSRGMKMNSGDLVATIETVASAVVASASPAARDRPQIFLSGNLHGNEWVGPAALLALAACGADAHA